MFVCVCIERDHLFGRSTHDFTDLIVFYASVLLGGNRALVGENTQPSTGACKGASSNDDLEKVPNNNNDLMIRIIFYFSLDSVFSVKVLNNDIPSRCFMYTFDVY